MLEPHRTMQRPGAGIVRPNGAATTHSEYPKHMVHSGYQPGKVGTEIKSPHGFSYHVGGEAIRFPPVLVTDEDQEAYHASQGYVTIGKSDPAAFARAVQAAAPSAEVHIPDAYPKWIAALGRSVDSAEEEAVALGLTNDGAPAPPATSSEEPSDAPALSAEVKSLLDAPHVANLAPPQDARLDVLEAKVDTIVSSFDRLSGMLAQVIAGQAPAVEAEPARAAKGPATPIPRPPTERSAASIARGEKIKAGLAAKKAAAEVAMAKAPSGAEEPVVADASQAVE